MRKLTQTITELLVILCIIFSILARANEIPDRAKTMLRLYCTPGMLNLAQQWADEYQSLNDDIIIQTKILKSGTGQMPKLAEADIALVTESDLSEISADAYRKFVIGRDVVVPVVSSDNPLSALIRNVGMSPQQLSDLVSGRCAKNWGVLDESGENNPINIYLSDDDQLGMVVAAFLSIPLAELTENQALDTPDLIDKIRSDKYGIGWCKLTDITDSESGDLLEGITLLPIDRNGNGQIDHFENIYTEINDFNRGIWIGKYPRTLVTDIYSVLPDAKPDNPGYGFVKWAITSGQETLAALGHNPMLSIEKMGVLDKMTAGVNLTEKADSGLSATAIILFILGGLILVIFIIAAIAGFAGNKAVTSIDLQRDETGFINSFLN